MSEQVDSAEEGARPPTLSRLRVRNFRCLADVEIPLSPLTAIVGPNGAGKTTILRAIDLVLGEIWPTLRSVRVPQDFTDFDTSREMEISVDFEPPFLHQDMLGTEHRISSIRVTCEQYKRSGRWGEAGDLHLNLDPLNEEGVIPNAAVSRPQAGQRPQFRPLNVGTALREHSRVLFVDHRRSLAQHLPGTRGSILGRLLQRARREFAAAEDFKKAYEEAMELLRTEQVRSIEQTVADTTKRMLGFLGSDRSKGIEIGFGFADPANPYNSLRLQYRESGLGVPGEELGLGIQSAMVVGVFEAFRQLGGDYGTVIIEEPEMYLHPQAQRYFYRLLCEMAECGQCQVIYSTHSPIFADVNRFESLRVVRREAGSPTNVSWVHEGAVADLGKSREAFKLGGRFDSARNEVLFARKALLVEGYGDRIAALLAAERAGIDVDAEGIAVVDCGGKAGIELLALVCRSLQIPFIVLHDEDVWPVDEGLEEDQRKKLAEENNAATAINARIEAATRGSGQLFVMSPTLEEALGIGRNARDKPRKVAEALEELDVESPPLGLQPLVDAVNSLRDP